MPYKVSVKIRFDAAHRLYGYEGKCKTLHGHTYTAVVEVMCAELAPPGFVIDFGDLKRVVKGWIDANWDHATILWVNDPLAQILVDHVYCMDYEPTAEHMAALLFHIVCQELPGTVVVSQVSIMETPTSTATYYV